MVMWKETTLMDGIKDDWNGLQIQTNDTLPPAPPAYTDKVGYKKYLDTLVAST
ncbi:MAG: hypothetical protein WCH65_02225 [bacterium]